MNAIDKLMKLEGERLEVFKLIDGSIGVHYIDCNTKDGSCIVGTFGHGLTIDSACEDYCNKISGKTLVFRFNKDSRKEVTVLF